MVGAEGRGHVVGHREVEEDAFRLPLGRPGHTAALASDGEALADAATPPAASRRHARWTPWTTRPKVCEPIQAENAEDFSLMQVERHALRSAPGRVRPPPRKYSAREAGGARLEKLPRDLAQHGGHDLGHLGAGGIEASSVAAIAQDLDPVGDGEDLRG